MVIAAAIRVWPGGKIYIGHSHAEARSSATQDGKSRFEVNSAEHGFMTDNGDFLYRVQSYINAVISGQLAASKELVETFKEYEEFAFLDYDIPELDSEMINFTEEQIVRAKEFSESKEKS